MGCIIVHINLHDALINRIYKSVTKNKKNYKLQQEIIYSNNFFFFWHKFVIELDIKYFCFHTFVKSRGTRKGLYAPLRSITKKYKQSYVLVINIYYFYKISILLFRIINLYVLLSWINCEEGHEEIVNISVFYIIC